MHVLLVTSWDTPCGIADHSKLLMEYVRRADPAIEITPSAEALDPQQFFTACRVHPDLVHLNHHNALHSRWQPHHVKALTDAETPVLLTFHDTTAGVSDQPSPAKLKALAAVSSSTIVHEPVGDLPAIYWRQGVPDPVKAARQFEWGKPPCLYAQQPILGTVGFHFPWKNYDRLCQLTAEVGWGLMILANNATQDDRARWQQLNPACYAVSGFLSTDEVLSHLSACDATCFAYECANTGTSGAIRLGIAARKPVIAFSHCRQFRDLLLDPLGRLSICWVDDWGGIARMLSQNLASSRYDPGIVHLAQQDSWVGLGQKYAKLYRALAEGAPL